MRAAPAFSRGAATAAALCIVAALAMTGCGKVSSCRPGTIFIHVDVTPYITANQVDIDVSVDGGAPVHTQLHFPAGTRSGGVEVQFPAGYPSGKNVDITLALSAGSGPVLATRTVRVIPAGECEAITVDFSSGDGGGGAGGAAGVAGAGGSAGGAAGRGGTGGGGAGTTGGGGGAGTTGGSGGAAAGRGGTGGSAGAAGGTAGTAGRGGTGGTAGSGGAAGRGGTGGTAAGGRGGGPACVPTGAEICFNGLDDDCDTRIDCADSDCSPTVAQCVTLDPGAGGRIGTLLAAGAACPTAFPDATALMNSLMLGACTGCSCARPPTSCSTTVASFNTAAACASGTTANAPSQLTPAMGCVKPDWFNTGLNSFGVVAGAFTPAVSGSCMPSGMAVPGAPTWGTNNRFCATTMIGGGCAAGQICIPVTPAAQRCQMFDGARTCPAGTMVATPFYTGYQGAQTCSACSCTQSAAASCASMRINIGSDWTCAPQVGAITAGGGRSCFSGTGVYEPGVEFVGTPTPPTCQGSSTPGSGTLMPTGPKTVCCM